MKRLSLYLFTGALLMTCALPTPALSDLTDWAQAAQHNGLTAYVQCNTTPTDSGMYYWYIRVVNVSTQPVDFSWNMVAPGVNPDVGTGSAVDAGWSEPPLLPVGQTYQSFALLQITCVTGGYSAISVYLKINSSSSGTSSTAVNMVPSNDIGNPVQAPTPTPTPSPTPTPCPDGWNQTPNGCVYSVSGVGVRGQAPTPVPAGEQAYRYDVDTMMGSNRFNDPVALGVQGTHYDVVTDDRNRIITVRVMRGTVLIEEMRDDYVGDSPYYTSVASYSDGHLTGTRKLKLDASGLEIRRTSTTQMASLPGIL